MTQAQRHITGLALALSIAGVLLAGGMEAAPTGKPIVVGITMPQTGPFADTGHWIEDGYKVWAEQVNAGAGLLDRPVQLKIYDDQGKADLGVQLLERLISVDKVDLILSGYPGSTVAAQAPVAEKYRMTYVGFGGHSPSFEQGYKYFFGAPAMIAAWFPLAALDWVKHTNGSAPEDRKLKTFALVNINNVIGKDFRKGTVDWLKANMPEARIAIDELHESPLGSADALAVRIKQARADVAMISNNLSDAVLVLRALKAQGYQPPFIFIGIGALVPEWKRELGALGNNVFAGSGNWLSSDMPGAALMTRLAQERYKGPPNSYFMLGYNYGVTLQAAVQGSKSLDQTKLRDWLRANPVDTPQGVLKFDARGLTAPVSYLVQIQSGTPVLIWPRARDAVPAIWPVPKW